MIELCPATETRTGPSANSTKYQLGEMGPGERENVFRGFGRSESDQSVSFSERKTPSYNASPSRHLRSRFRDTDTRPGDANGLTIT